MSKKPARGGAVQIGGVTYIATEAPERCGERFLLTIFSPANEQVYLAESEGWRNGCGPWRLTTTALLPHDGKATP